MNLPAFLLASSIVAVSIAASDDSKMVRGGGVVATADDVDVDVIMATKHNVLRGVNFFKTIAEGEYVVGRYCDATSCDPYCAPFSCGNNPNDNNSCGLPCTRQKKGCPSGRTCVDCNDWGSDGYYCE